jgi:D-arabinose 1-dehydrogenase-like Zn-dependent alcohol dehydrogenase
VSFDLRRLFWYQQTILGSTMGSRAEYQRVVALLGEGKLRAVVDSTYAFSDARSAFERLAAGDQQGKVVVELPD